MNRKTPFGVALKYYRKLEKNLTQEKFAGKVGCKQSMISDIEKGKKDGSADLREKITEYFKIPYDEFLETGREKLKLGQSEGIDSLADKVADKLKDRLPDLYQQTNEPPEPENDIEKQKIQRHHEIIAAFQNQQLAIEVIQLFAKYEKLEADAGLSEIKRYLTFRINEAEREKRALKTGATGTEGK